MTKKPSYEDLEKKIQALEQAENEIQNTKEALKRSEERYRAIIETQTELICRFKPD